MVSVPLKTLRTFRQSNSERFRKYYFVFTLFCLSNISLISEVEWLFGNSNIFTASARRFLSCTVTPLSLSSGAWKVSKYQVFSGPYFPTFGLNIEKYGVSLRLQFECGKTRTRKNFAFGHISCSVVVLEMMVYLSCKRLILLFIVWLWQIQSKGH